MGNIAITFLMLTGATFLLLAAIGINRMPDLYSRMQAAAKGTTLGVICLVVALAVQFNDFSISVRALLVVAFLVLTAPVAVHMIGRAAYISGVPLWEKSVIDELRGRYDMATSQGPASPEPGTAQAFSKPEEDTPEL